MKQLFGNRTREAVFLCYHSIERQGARYLTLPPDLFERQLSRLRRHGYRSGGFSDLEKLARGERLDRPTAFLTFDDGYRDNFELAMPIMMEYGFRPIVFLLPEHVERAAPFEWPEMREAQAAHPRQLRSLTWSQVDDMLSHGAEFGSHTVTHPHLRDLDDDALAFELTESRAKIEGQIGRCDMLAYPFGEWDARVAAVARSAGYGFAFSLPQGPQAEADRFSIPRINVDSRDDGVRWRFKVHPLGRRYLLSQISERAREARRAIRGGARREEPAAATGGSR